MRRPSLLYLALALGTVAAGLILRFTALGMPQLIVRYGGSVLWAAMVYLLLASIQPSRESRSIAIIATAIAWLVELSRLVHTPALDAFRLTLTGALLLGRVFNPWHLLAYAATIAFCAVADQQILRKIHP